MKKRFVLSLCLTLFTSAMTAAVEPVGSLGGRISWTSSVFAGWYGSRPDERRYWNHRCRHGTMFLCISPRGLITSDI